MATKLCTWHDTVTPESAADGDYATTGESWHTNAYSTSELLALATDYVRAVRDAGAEVPECPVHDVAYGEPYTSDYSTAEESTECVALHVDKRYSARRKAVLIKLIKRAARRK